MLCLRKVIKKKRRKTEKRDFHDFVLEILFYYFSSIIFLLLDYAISCFLPVGYY